MHEPRSEPMGRVGASSPKLPQVVWPTFDVQVHCVLASHGLDGAGPSVIARRACSFPPHPATLILDHFVEKIPPDVEPSYGGLYTCSTGPVLAAPKLPSSPSVSMVQGFPTGPQERPRIGPQYRPLPSIWAPIFLKRWLILVL